MLSCFHLIPERYGQTDRRTDIIGISISCISVLMRDKNYATGHLPNGTWLDIKFTMHFFASFPADRYLSSGATDCHEIWHNNRTMSTPLFFQWLPNVGSRKGVGWTIFGLSDTHFPHLTVNIFRTVTRSITHQFGLNTLEMSFLTNVWCIGH